MQFYGNYWLSSVQLLGRVQLFATPCTAACQGSLSITNSHSVLKLMSIESVMPSNHLIFYCPILLLSSIFPSIRIFSDESVLHIRRPKYWSFGFSISFIIHFSCSRFPCCLFILFTGFSQQEYCITISMYLNLSKLQEIVEDRGAWCAAVLGVTESQLNNSCY